MAWQDRQYSRGDASPNVRLGFTPPSRMALSVMGACFGVFVLQNVTQTPLHPSGLVTEWGRLTFRGALAFIHPWRVVTYQYLHGDPLHIFFNLLGTYFFLCPLERQWGWRKALAFYTAGGVVAAFAFGLLDWATSTHGSLIGASGSVLAALGACAMLFPEMTVYLIVIPVPIRVLAVLAAVLYALFIVGSRDLSGAAHLGGLAFGALAPWGIGPAWSRFLHGLHLRRLRRTTVLEQIEQEDVDRILQKVHDHGMHGLNWRERRVLRKATERQRQRDMELSRRRSF